MTAADKTENKLTGSLDSEKIQQQKTTFKSLSTFQNRTANYIRKCFATIICLAEFQHPNTAAKIKI